jgi:cysteine desulfurase
MAAALKRWPIGDHGLGPRDALPMCLWMNALGHSVCDMEYPLGQAGAIYQPFEAFGCGHILALTMPGVSAEAQLVQFDLAGISVSAGSACSSGTMKTSRVLKAFGVPDEEAACTIRVSIGWTTRGEDLAAFEQAWLQIASRRARAA